MTDWRALTADLSRTTSRHAPGWTDHADADPGVTLIELIAFLSESLYREVGRVEGGTAAAARILRALEPYADAGRPGVSPTEPSPAAVTCWSGERRNRYFDGKVMNADAFAVEQAYLVGRHRRHLRTLHGSGIVSGLAVSPGADGTSVLVAPGAAIDPEGREILVACPFAVTLPPGSPSALWVTIEYVERQVGETPTLSGDDSDRLVEPSWIEEGCRVDLIDSVREPQLAIARLRYEEARWRVDPSFEPARPR
jgi:hypothetical protein